VSLALVAVGVFAFAVAVLSVADMFLPHPYDGVVLQADTPGQLKVSEVMAGSGAADAGILAGDEIIGIGRSALRSPAHAASMLSQHAIGESVAYLVKHGNELREVMVKLGPRRIGDSAYLYACLLGFSFFFIGLFVLLQQPRLQASQVLFILCSLFLLVLVCRLRPASYSWVDTFVLTTGTAALVLLPASFLHFFLIFPRPVWELAPGAATRSLGRRWRPLLVTAYLIPPLVLLCTLAATLWRNRDYQLISGAPSANWWVLALYVGLGLFALARNARRLPASRERRGAGMVFVGSLVGLLPFLIAAVGFPSFLHTEKFLFYGVVPLVLVPITFAYAIVRFQMLDVRVILRKSLLYTGTTAVVTGIYALGIAWFNSFFRSTTLSTSPYFPIVFALAIVLLFEPLRRRLQGPVDRFFFSDRTRLQAAMVEMGEAFTGRLDPASVVHDLVQELPRLLGLRFAALYLLKGEAFERVAGPDTLPASLPLLRGFYRQVQSYTTMTRLADLTTLRLNTDEVRALVAELAAAGVEVLGDLATSRRRIGLVMLSAKTGSISLEEEELRLLRGLLHQAAIALETSQLLEERAKQAELERELEIAAQIQRSLLPPELGIGEGYEVAAVCQPARHVGGDFFAQLAGPEGDGATALVYGDVSGKSVPGALMMMAAKEVLHALSLVHGDPEELLALANRRLHEIGNRGFVALGYLSRNGSRDGLRYLLAGQPPPLKRAADGTVSALPLPAHRLPLGAMARGRHRALEVKLAAGELLLAYSDGVVEAHAPGGDFFGEERLAACLAQAPQGAHAVIEHVLRALDEFTRHGEAYDDVTLVAVRRLAAPVPREESPDA
jgi:serine phosphatase RsbU (regulator of sigma subunit)